MNKEYSERYRGHLSLCEIDLTGQQAISRSRVLIVGAGGLGSPVALYLAAAGVGTLGIIDADTVSLSNLQRQIIHTTDSIGLPKVESADRALRAINPGVEVTTYCCFLSADNAAEILPDYDVVVDCTDSRCSRRLISGLCNAHGKPCVFGAVSRFSGLLFTHLPGTASYADIFTDEDTDTQELSCAMTGILNSVVGVVGSIQATEVLKIITKTGDLLTNRLLTIDLLSMEFHILDLSR